LLEAFKNDPCAIFSGSRKYLLSVPGVGEKIVDILTNWSDYFNLAREKERISQSGIHFFSAEHLHYPSLLKEIYDPPIGLYWRGAYSIDRPCVAIVGTRQPSLYGLKVAREFAAELTRLGFCIVSGMARGIDSAAHEGALSAGGPTVAVLGSGLDIIYPPENKDLYDEIVNNGAVVSEFPFGRRADRQSFPMRNRVVSGICKAVIVVETGMQGGSMITARFAGEQGRNIMAVPGRIDQRPALGCLDLIRDGAILVSSVNDILEELGYQNESSKGAPTKGDEQENNASLGPQELAILNLLKGGALETIDTITIALGYNVHEVSAQLTALELKQLLRRRVDGFFEAC
jgi:DNA processing protein